MRKLMLDVAALEVQSFEAGRQSGAGTVRGRDSGYYGSEDSGPDYACAEEGASWRGATCEGDSCSPCSTPGQGQCVNLSMAGPTWCPKSACL